MTKSTWPKSWLTETPGKRCPNCGERTGRPILWGMPAHEVEDACWKGVIDISFGGCIVDDDDPKYQCRNCETRFG